MNLCFKDKVASNTSVIIWDMKYYHTNFHNNAMRQGLLISTFYR